MSCFNLVHLQVTAVQIKLNALWYSQKFRYVCYRKNQQLSFTGLKKMSYLYEVMIKIVCLTPPPRKKKMCEYNWVLGFIEAAL